MSGRCTAGRCGVRGKQRVEYALMFTAGFLQPAGNTQG
jgi:hypothetical protein